MKKIIISILIFSSSFIEAQEPLRDYSQEVSSLDNIMETLYGVISGEKGEARNWDLFRELFKPGAKLIPSGKNKEGVIGLRYMTPEEYIESSGRWLVENGFFENELHRTVQTFGTITQVFSTYESFHSMTETEPFMRGINSIQLLNDGKRWWIVNIFWAHETKDNPIPGRFLPN